MRSHLPLAGAASALLVFSGLSAQETITSDRPGIGSGSGIVAQGVVQLETGFSYGGGPGGGELSIGQALVRVGLSGFELELFGNSYVVDLDDGTGSTDGLGLQDAGVGVKLPLVREDELSISLQGLTVLPTGSARLTGDAWLFGANGLADWGLGERTALSGNVGVLGGGGSDPVLTVTLTPSYAFDGGLSGYAGWAGTFVSGANASFVEAGLAYLANADMQLDLNWGWSPDSEVWFLGAGIAIRRGGR